MAYVCYLQIQGLMPICLQWTIKMQPTHSIELGNGMYNTGIVICRENNENA